MKAGQDGMGTLSGLQTHLLVVPRVGPEQNRTL